VRIVIADDSMLVREGIASLLRGAGLDVVAQCSTGEELLREADALRPDLAIVDVRMPPTHTDEGLRAANELRARQPGIGVVILSQHVEVGVATRVLAESLQGLGYLVKDRVSDLEDFLDTLHRVADGGTALDPLVVSALLASTREEGPLATLTAREREVLELVAEGLSNQAIAERMTITLRSTEKYVSSIFGKLELPDSPGEQRRVHAVLQYLRVA
jgi:DNA-binding NarL/FixJ family response regulator